MPDFEMLIRDLELHLAKTPIEKAYAKGRHAGIDEARKQILKIDAATACLSLLVFSFV